MYKEYITQKEFKCLLENSPSNARFVVYYVSESKKPKIMKTKKNKYTLNQLGETVDKLSTKVDKLSTKVDKLVETVDKGFRQVNARIDKIEERLDYVVTANKLKDLPKSK